MSGAAPQGDNQNAAYMGPIWIVIGIFLLGFGIWYFAHTQIVTGFFYVKRFEIAVIQFFVNVLQNVKLYILNTPPDQATFSNMTYVAEQVGYYLRFPIMIIVFLLGSVLFIKSSARRYRQVYNMSSLLNAEVVNWPQTTPILDKNLLKEDIDKGPWAMAMTPMRFAKRYKLLQERQDDFGEGFLAKKNKISVSLIKDRANRVFTLQVGSFWYGIDKLKPHVKALYAVFAARAGRDSKAAEDLLLRLSLSASSKEFDYSGVDELLKKHGEAQAVVDVTNRHAYVLTVMASMIELARIDGVLPTASFLWLKPIDRRLWFMLNSVGRQTAVAEVAGSFAHWLAEREVEHKIRMPMIERATAALEEAIADIAYNSNSEY